MARIIGRKIIHHDQVTSTNDLVRDSAEHGEPEGLVITAEEQTQGRGRLGRKWIAPAGTSVQFSVLLRPALQPAQAGRLTYMGALAVAAALREKLGLEAAFKWPNDVLLNHKKCAGILIESTLNDEAISYAILGVGLNVNFSLRDDEQLASFATTLADELGREIDRSKLLDSLLTNLDDYYARLRTGQDFFPEWRARLATLGRFVRIATPSQVQEGIAEDVDPDGALLVRHREQLIRIYAGDVTIIKESNSGSS